MTHVAEVYLRIDSFRPDPVALRRRGDLLSRLAYDAARETYPVNVDIEVYLEPGSLLAWVSAVAMGLGAIWGTVATYPDFKRGLSEAYKDAKRFGRFVIGGFVSSPVQGSSKDLYSQKRTKTPGRLLRNLNR